MKKQDIRNFSRKVSYESSKASQKQSDVVGAKSLGRLFRKKDVFFVENAKVKIKNFSYIDKEAQNGIIFVYVAIVHF